MKYLSWKYLSRSGFTLAEVMIVLFVLTVILAAFAPMMTTRTKVNISSPWRYAAPDTANTYFGLYDNQRAMIGQKSSDDDEIDAKLTINTPSSYASILFRENEAATGQLTMTSGGSVILGGSDSTVFPSGDYYATGIGYGALASLTTGAYNTAVGYNAFTDLTTSNRNTAIGYNACQGISGVLYNDYYYTCIGADSGSGTPSVTDDNYLYLGNQYTTVLVANSSNNMTNLLSIISNASSDQRLKNIKGENTAGLDKIKQMKTYDYTFKSDKKQEPHVGVIAQEVQKFFPEAVFKDENGYLAIRKESLFFAVINAIKELASQTSDKDLKIQELEKKNAELEERLLKLEEKVETLSSSKKKFTFGSKKHRTADES